MLSEETKQALEQAGANWAEAIQEYRKAQQAGAPGLDDFAAILQSMSVNYSLILQAAGLEAALDQNAFARAHIERQTAAIERIAEALGGGMP